MVMRKTLEKSPFLVLWVSLLFSGIVILLGFLEFLADLRKLHFGTMISKRVSSAIIMRGNSRERDRSY